MREVLHLPRQNKGITGSNTDPLRRIRKSQKLIGTRGQESLCVPRTQRVSHCIQGRPYQDARARKQEMKNDVHRTIEGKKSSRD